jgi:hypothetical protein
MSRQVITVGDPASESAAIAPGALLAGAAAAACGAAWRRAAALVAAGRGARRLPSTGQVVVTR